MFNVQVTAVRGRGLADTREDTLGDVLRVHTGEGGDEEGDGGDERELHVVLACGQGRRWGRGRAGWRDGSELGEPRRARQAKALIYRGVGQEPTPS